MSEVTRAQIRTLMRQAEQLIQQCQGIRLELVTVVHPIKATAVASEPADDREQPPSNRKATR